MGSGARVYHVGFVVPDLDAAIADVSEGLGVTFTEPMTLPYPTLQTPDGPKDVSLRLAYTARPAHIELIGDVPGSLWDFTDSRRGHHLGVWADDVDAEADRLDARGWRRMWWATNEDGRLAFSYHDTPYGFYIELVGTVAKGFYPTWFSQADPELLPATTAGKPQ
jgi:catechol 2,3-dioxygenase-like lactoylglutathione lyase family enzyme